MEPEDYKAVVSDFWQKVFTEGNLDVADELFAPDHVLHIPSLPSPLRDATGPDAIKSFVALPRRVSPDIQVTVKDWVAEGEKVVTYWTARGTLADEMMRGADYDNDGITASGVTIYRVSDGQIRESLWLFEARVDEPQRPLREEIREFVLQDISEDLSEEYARPMCCFWTGCRCT
jgi:ketosteroid isomerase-like protein